VEPFVLRVSLSGSDDSKSTIKAKMSVGLRFAKSLQQMTFSFFKLLWEEQPNRFAG
jgi:hypothetical protein